MPSRRPLSAFALTAALISSMLGLAAERADEVDHGAVRHRHAHRDAVQLAQHLGDHEPDRARGAGRGRDDRERRGARTAQVAVRRVVQTLVARVGVRRRHEARLDAELVQQHAHDGREAVGRARRHRDELMLVAVVGLLVDARARASRRDPWPGAEITTLRAPAAMCASARRSAKKPVDSSTTSAPRSAHGRSAGSRCETTLSASPSTIMPSLGGLDDALVAAQHRVVLEQVRERGGVRQVVDRDDVDVGAGLLRGAEEVAADAAEAVDADANGHALPSSVHAAAQRTRFGPCSILPRSIASGRASSPPAADCSAPRPMGTVPSLRAHPTAGETHVALGFYFTPTGFTPAIYDETRHEARGGRRRLAAGQALPRRARERRPDPGLRRLGVAGDVRGLRGDARADHDRSAASTRASRWSRRCTTSSQG